MTNQLDFDPELRVFTLAKPLMAGLTYPYGRPRPRMAILSTSW